MCAIHSSMGTLPHHRIFRRIETLNQWMKLAGALSCLAPFVLCTSCAFTRLKRDLRTVEENVASIEGQVIGNVAGSGPILVVVRDASGVNRNILRHWPMYRPSTFRFAVPAPGEYCVLAFKDRNGDFRYQRNEPAAFSQKGPTILLSAGQQLDDLRISLREDSRVDVDFAIDLSSPAQTVTLNNLKVSYGEITDIDDPRFTLANASMGMWEPLRFVQEVGAGIYFLEPFDPRKTPMLFVHGLSGHPGQWKYIVEDIDRDHFQPWLFFYPSGARLRFLGDELYRMVERLRVQHGFTDMHVVAHSMGGLVSRKFLNDLAGQKSPIRVPLFVTISTPWGGHEAAEVGVKRAPAIVPSWLDMLPGSDFQDGLWETALPPDTAYHLMFSFRGKGSMYMDRNNDGTVTLASELDWRAQEAASRQYGFFEDHVSILSSQQVSEVLARILNEGRARTSSAP